MYVVCRIDPSLLAHLLGYDQDLCKVVIVTSNDLPHLRHTLMCPPSIAPHVNLFTNVSREHRHSRTREEKYHAR